MRTRRSGMVGGLCLLATALAGCGTGAQQTSGSPSATSQRPTPSVVPTTVPTPPGTTTAVPSTTAPRSVPPPPTTRTTTHPPTTYQPPAGLLGRVIDRVPTARRVVALTFDAGANGDGVASIVGTLRREHVPATFFLTGDFVAAYPALAHEMAAAGRVGDHTVSHPHLPQLSEAAVAREVLDARAEIIATAGADPRPLFRFPYGDWSGRTLALVNRLGFVAVGWTVDTLGWEGTGAGVTVSSIVARVSGAAGPGEIVLMHVGSNPDDHSALDAQALPQVIAALRSAGYGFVTLDALSG